MKKTILLAFLSLLFCLPSWAKVDQNIIELVNNPTTISMIQNFDLGPQDLIKMIDLFEKMGQISSEQAQAARQEISKLSEEDFNRIKEKAKKKIEQHDGDLESLKQEILNQ